MNVNKFKELTNSKCSLCGNSFVNHPDFQLYCDHHIIYEEFNNSGFGDNIVKIVVSDNILLVFTFLTNELEFYSYKDDTIDKFIKSFKCNDITAWFLSREELLLKVNEYIGGLLILL